MKPPAWAMTSQLSLEARVKTENTYGEEVILWEALPGPLRCAAFPAGSRALRVAGLLGVSVSHEVYLAIGLQVSPTASRAVLEGVAYGVQNVAQWDGFTVLLLGTTAEV